MLPASPPVLLPVHRGFTARCGSPPPALSQL